MILKLGKLSKATIFFWIIFLILVSLYTPAIANQEQEDTNKEILATVNDEIITLVDFEKYWSMIPENYKVQLKKVDVLEQMITQSLLIQKSDEMNLREDPEVAFQIKATVEQILIQVLLEKEIVEKTTLSDEDFQAYYEEHREDYWQEEEVRAFDILVETREQAEEIILKLKEGQEFTALAQESSIASSAVDGGDLGFIRKGTLVDEIEEKLFTLDLEEISEIIPVENGFHVFKVTEKNPSGYLELSVVKGEIESQLLPMRQQEAFDQYLKNIEEQAIIVRNIELLEEPEPEEQQEENSDENIINQ